MKKVLLMQGLAWLTLMLSAQVRLTEVFPVDGKLQFIELYSKPGSGYLLDDYYVVSYMKNITTGTVTIYLIDFNNGVSPFTGTNSYVVYSKYPKDKVGSTSYTYTLFSSVATVWKYTKTTAQTSFSSPVADPPEDYFSDSQAEMGIFLFKRTSPSATSATLIDFVTHVKDGGSQTTKHALITASLNTLPSFNYAGVSFSFNGVLVSKAKHVIADPGSSSYNLKLVNCIPTWFKDNPTPWSGQLIDAVPTWDAFSFYYKQTGTRVLSNIVDHDYYSSGEIPKQSLSYINLVVNPKPMSSNFECYISFRYLLDATVNNIRVSLYQDTDGDGIIDAGEPFVNGMQDIVPGDAVKLPVYSYGSEDYYKMNFSLTPQSPTAQLFFPVIIKTNYVTVTNGTTCTFSTTEQIKFASDLALPVTLGDFNARFEKEKVMLEWLTQTETNNRGFEIQRALKDGDGFKPIAFHRTKAKDGFSQSALKYQYEDNDVDPEQVYYYRLQQVDFDGKTSLSPIRHVLTGSLPIDLIYYPNPSAGKVTLKTGMQGKLGIQILDPSGRVVKQLENVTGETQLSGLPKGIYTILLQNYTNGKKQSHRLIIQ